MENFSKEQQDLQQKLREQEELLERIQRDIEAKERLEANGFGYEEQQIDSRQSFAQKPNYNKQKPN